MSSEIEDLKKKLLDGDTTADTYEELSRSLLYPPARMPIDLLPNLDMQVTNLMQMQLIAQRQLHEQLEVQRNLHLTKEQLKKSINMFGQHQQHIDAISHIENTTGMQFKDALQMQLAVQRQLHEQLEIQRNTQMKIEEQARILKKMFDQRQQDQSNMSQNPEIKCGNDDHHSHES